MNEQLQKQPPGPREHAKSMISQALATLPIPLDQHTRLQQAVQTLYNCPVPPTVKEPTKEDEKNPKKDAKLSIVKDDKKEPPKDEKK